MASDSQCICAEEKGNGIAVDSDSGSDSWGSPDLGQDENLAWHLTEEQLAEEEVLEATNAELALCLALMEAAEACLGEGSGAEDLVQLQRDALTVFSSSAATSSTIGELSRSRPCCGGPSS